MQSAGATTKARTTHDIPLDESAADRAQGQAQAAAVRGAPIRATPTSGRCSRRRAPRRQGAHPGRASTSTSNYVEHPELVAERLVPVRRIVGRERVIAGTDCGFGTFAGFGPVDPDIVYKKLAAIAEGAALATEQLW